MKRKTRGVHVSWFAKRRTLVQFTIGQKASFSKTITEADVLAFAVIGGGQNPLHLDEEYAKRSRFGARIAHGTFTFGVISAAMGNAMLGAVYLSQTIKFLKPVYFNDTITAIAETMRFAQTRASSH